MWADDLVLLAEAQGDLQKLLDFREEVAARLKLRFKQNKYTVLSWGGTGRTVKPTERVSADERHHQILGGGPDWRPDY